MAIITQKYLSLAGIVVLFMCHSAFADPVTGWVTIFDGDGGAGFSGGSEATDSPVTTDVKKVSIAANFEPVTLADHDILELTGSVSLSVDLANNQFRWGLFDGDDPVTAGDGAGYEGYYVTSVTTSLGGGSLKYGNGGVPPDVPVHPFAAGQGTLLLDAATGTGGNVAADTVLDFVFTIARNEANVDITASFTDGDTYNIAYSGGNTSSDPDAPAVFTYNSVAFLMGGGFPDIGQATYGNIDVSLSQVQSLTLEVNTDTGSTRIVNNSGQRFDINAYEILSANGSLDPIDWYSLDEQNIDAIGGGEGESWDKAGGSDASALSEIFLLGSSSLGMGDSLNLGAAFDAGELQDLEFNFTLLGATEVSTGFVEYVTGVDDNADFDGDGDVDGADFLTWQRGFGAAGERVDGDANGDGDVNSADLAIWESQFGTGGNGSLANVAVPEPTTFWLACVTLFMAVRFVGRRVGR